MDALICGGRIKTRTDRQARRAGGWMDGWGGPHAILCSAYLVDDFWLSNTPHPVCVSHCDGEGGGLHEGVVCGMLLCSLPAVRLPPPRSARQSTLPAPNLVCRPSTHRVT